MSVSPFGPLRVGPVVVAHTAASVEADADEEPPSHACDTEVLEVVEAVIEALAQAGVSAVSAAVSPRRPELPDALLKRPGTTIFNLVESTAGAATMEVDFARWLEARGVPFTGNPAAALRLALRKDLTREHLARFDIPMAEGVVAHSPDVALPDMPGPGSSSPRGPTAPSASTRGRWSRTPSGARPASPGSCATSKAPAWSSATCPDPS